MAINYNIVLDGIRAVMKLWREKHEREQELRMKLARLDFNIPVHVHDQLVQEQRQIRHDLELVTTQDFNGRMTLREPRSIISVATYRACGISSNEDFNNAEKYVGEYTEKFLRLCARKGLENI